MVDRIRWHGAVDGRLDAVEICWSADRGPLAGEMAFAVGREKGIWPKDNDGCQRVE